MSLNKQEEEEEEDLISIKAIEEVKVNRRETVSRKDHTWERRAKRWRPGRITEGLSQTLPCEHLSWEAEVSAAEHSNQSDGRTLTMALLSYRRGTDWD